MPSLSPTTSHRSRWWVQAGLPLLALFVAILAWLFPTPSIPKPLNSYIVPSLLAACSIIIFLGYLLLIARTLRASFKTTLLLLIVYALSIVTTAISLHYVLDHNEHSRIARPDPNFSGKITFLTYCQNRFGAGASLDSNSSACVTDTDTYPFTAKDVCFWQYGSEAHEAEPLALLVTCDISARTQPPCSKEQRFCGAEQDFCCPLIKSQ
jgi:hypothetical protein